MEDFHPREAQQAALTKKPKAAQQENLQLERAE
jgi:hypothetical protein